MAQVIGKLIKIMPEVSGSSTRGEWVRGGFVMLCGDGDSRSVALTLFGRDRIDMLKGLSIGDTVIADYFPESHEYGNKWFTDLRCTHIMVARK